MNFLSVIFLSLAAVSYISPSQAGPRPHKSSTKDAGAKWCYKGSCGPNSQAWPETCHSGKRQTPIDLPQSVFATGRASIRLNGYRGDHFRLQNNGHTVVVDFKGNSGNNEGPTAQPFKFPDPLLVTKLNPADQKILDYKFESAHLHWGPKDGEGSEHCVAKRCSSMELHLVHFLANYSSLQSAIDSKLENALAVVGVLIDVNPVGGSPGSPLAPIAKHLENVTEPKAQPVSVHESLDLTQMFLSEEMQFFTYKGSLTTPACNEQVNWYVMRRPALATTEELKAFRTKLKDSHGDVLDLNYRPTQDRNGRDVILTDVLPAQ